jgi:hypothetical protein
MNYAAPEQWNPRERYTDKVDVFTFGMVAYEIIEGKIAHPETDSSRLSNPPRYFGSLMAQLIVRCWSLNPCERPSFEAILKAFKVSGWAILPDIDVKAVAGSVSDVLRRENPTRRSMI